MCPGGIGTAPCSQTATLNYSVRDQGTLGTPKVLTEGAANLDFTLASGSTCTGSVTAGQSCTVNVTFAPKYPGLRRGAVEIVDGSGNVLATTYIYGVGVGPEIVFDPGTQTTVGSGLISPFGVAVDAAGNVYIADNSNNRVVEVPAGGGAQTTVASGLNYPYGVAVDGAGNVYISDTLNNGRVVEVPAGGGAQTTVGSGLHLPHGLAVDGAGNVYIADTSNNRVVEVPAGGGAQTTVASGLDKPVGVAVDGAGNVYIADTGNNRVVEVPAGGGAQTTVASGFNSPFGVAVDAAGNVYIADNFNNGRVVEVPAGGGAQTTIVGSGLFFADGVAVDAAGNVYIADNGNNRVVEVQRSQAPALTFADTTVGNTSSDSPQAVMVENIGNSLLTGTVGAPTNTSFTVGSGGCGSAFSLAAGASCTLSYSFTPLAGGPLTGSATLTDNSLNASNAMQSILLGGNGVALGQTITFNALPDRAVGATFIVERDGEFELAGELHIDTR